LTQGQKVSNKAGALALMGLLLLGGCATSKNLAPVEDRVVGARAAVAAAPAPAPAASAPVADAAKAAAAEAAKAAAAAAAASAAAAEAAKAGSYTVKPGDTMIRIGLEAGQPWKDIARWNNLEAPYTLEPGQVLRVAPPASEVSTGPRAVAAAKVESRPLDAKPGTAASAPVSTAPVVVQAPSAPAAREPDDDVNWQWPASGAVLAGFEEGKTKGLLIAGKPGDAVLAAAEGKVVYAGSGLRGYGNLVILKHNSTYLTAYAHNQALLVKEDQTVKRGQKIAEMGSTDASRVQLHFEIRRQGKPIDPAKLLPPR
jgi:lipoprotein NlpD